MHTTDLRTSLQRRLGSAYTLERELGGGGMSRVFLAEEAALGRPVVVKVLEPELAEGLSAERFAREVRVAARLQHPNIVPVFAAGDAGGAPYYTMPYIAGESLRARIDRERAFPRADAIAILRDVARALEYAHEKGIVHRDVKPENVLLSGDAALVTDFGIAKALDAARGAASGTRLTQVGVAVGTPAYMAPEQFSGEATVDHRADLYAWGVVAYELLAGHHPFADKRSTQALFAAHLVEAPAPLDGLCSGVPGALSSLVMRCLAKDRAARPQAARELVGALAGTAVPPTGFAATSSPPLPALAVLPFVNLSADPENEYFSDGISEEVLSVLAQNAGLRVAARSSSFSFKGHTTDLHAVAEQLQVTMLLEGSVRRAGNRVRITVQLVNAADGYQLWSERYDRELTDIFAVQEDIATAIGATLARRLRDPADDSDGEAPAPHARGRSRQRVSVEAYDEYLKGRYANRNSRGFGHEPGPAHFRRALEIEPTFAAAHAGLAESHLWLAFSSMPPSEAFPMVRRHARRALALDPESADAHWLLGEAALWNDWDVDLADEYARAALALEPSHAEATMTTALCLNARGRTTEAMAAARTALAIDPVTVGTRSWFVATVFNLGAFELSRDEATRLLIAHPDYSEGYRWRSLAHLVLGDLAAAQADVVTASSLAIGNSWGARTEAVVASQAGDIAAVRRILENLLSRSEKEWRSPMMIAQVHQALGDYDAAFLWYERALHQRDHLLAVLHTDRSFQLSPPGAPPITSDPRWRALISRIGLATAGAPRTP